MGEGRGGSWESKTNNELSKMESVWRHTNARQSLEEQVNLQGCGHDVGMQRAKEQPREVFEGDVSIGRLWRHPLASRL